MPYKNKTDKQEANRRWVLRQLTDEQRSVREANRNAREAAIARNLVLKACTEVSYRDCQFCARLFVVSNRKNASKICCSKVCSEARWHERDRIRQRGRIRKNRIRIEDPIKHQERCAKYYQANKTVVQELKRARKRKIRTQRNELELRMTINKLNRESENAVPQS